MKEIWKDIKGYECLYKISNFGKVYSYALNDIKKQTIGKRGYYVIDLFNKGKRKNVKIHRLIAIRFIPNPENKPHVNHINGIKTDNRIENLEWVTKKENEIHAIKTGLKNDFGSNHHNAKLKESDIVFIRTNKNISDSNMAKKFNVSRKNINMIRNFKRWRHVK